MLDLAAVLADVRLNWALYLAMPIIAAVIGYVTKVVAIRMMFRPYEFVGVRPWLGWQGIVPSKAGTMAAIMHDTLTRRLLDPAELVGRLDPRRVAREIEPPLLLSLEGITHQVMLRHKPGLWESLPGSMKRGLIQRLQAEMPIVVAQMIRDLQINLGSVLDLKTMMVTRLSRDKALLNRIFMQAGREEFRFIRRSGIYFGLLIGCVQAVVWAFTHSVWVMPLFGGFVGWFSDWMALKMVFRPREPRRYLGVFRWHGLFLKRQQEVAAEYGALIADEVLTTSSLLEAVLRGPLSDNLFGMVQRHVGDVIDKQAGYAQPLVVYAIGTAKYQSMKRDVVTDMMSRMSETLKHLEPYAAEAMDIRATLIERLGLMTPEEFESVLRPVFEQDEWKLIAVGAVLGFLVGELQVFLMLHM